MRQKWCKKERGILNRACIASVDPLVTTTTYCLAYVWVHRKKVVKDPLLLRPAMVDIKTHDGAQKPPGLHYSNLGDVNNQCCSRVPSTSDFLKMTLLDGKTAVLPRPQEITGSVSRASSRFLDISCLFKVPCRPVPQKTQSSSLKWNEAKETCSATSVHYYTIS